MDAPAIDLTVLVERLRAAGFRVDTRQYLTAYELLLAFAERGQPLGDDAAALASHLGPIFCTLPDEQRRFAAEVEAWRGVPIPPPTPELTGPAPRPFGLWRRWRWAGIGGALVVAFAAGTLAFAYREFTPVHVDGTVAAAAPDGTTAPAPQAQVRFRGQPVPVDAQGRFRLTTTRAAGEGSLEAELDGHVHARASIHATTASPIRLTLKTEPAPPLADPTAPVIVGPPRTVGLGAPVRPILRGGLPIWTLAAGSALSGLIAFTLLWLVGRAKARLALKRLEALGDAEEVALAPPDTPAVSLPDHEMRRLAAALRRPQEQAIIELNTPASVDATLRAGGLFAPIYMARRAMPEYLVLVHRRSVGDHWADWVDEWIDRLAATGVSTDRFTFLDDPRTCFVDDEKRHAHRLLDLVARHDRATVLLFAESRVCFDPLRGTLLPWVATLSALPRRVLFTPEAPFRWSKREWSLSAEGFVVLPAGEEGFRSYAEMAGDWRIERMFPAPYSRAYPALLADEPQRWLDRNAPPEALVERLVRQLRGYLGPDGFAWLCACTVYPQISWPLTLQLAGCGNASGGAVEAGDRALDPLPSLARLPWLRHGFAPDWLRHTLLSQLSPEQQNTIRQRLEALLERLVLSASPEAAKAGHLDTRGQRASASSLLISRFIGPVDLLRAAPAASLLRDRVFLGFMAGVSADPLTMQVGAAFRNLFRGSVARLPEANPAGERATATTAPAAPATTPAATAATPERLRIHVIYRRRDSAPYAGRLVDNLRALLVNAEIGLDTLPDQADDSSSRMPSTARSANVVLVIIGPRWLGRESVER